MGDVNNRSRNKEKETHLEVLRNLTNKTLEGELADEELGRLLVAPDLAEGDGARAVAAVPSKVSDGSRS